MVNHPCFIFYMVHSALVAAVTSPFTARNLLRCANVKSLINAAKLPQFVTIRRGNGV